jgi:NPCBM/NEW2 domain
MSAAPTTAALPHASTGLQPAGRSTVSNSGDLFNGSVEVNGRFYPNSIILYLNPGPADVEYNLGRQWQSLEATVGLQDDSSANEDIDFQIFADGRSIYDHRFTLGQSRSIMLNVAGVLRLQLVATLVSGYVGPAQAVWGDADLLS